MKRLIILVSLSFFIIQLPAQILGEDEDVNQNDFTFESLNELDARMALQLAERKLQTMLAGAINTGLASVPWVGTGGVQREILGSNVKLDELITLSKNYNYKLTSVLGNILKVVKESRDGTIATRAKNLFLKGKVIQEATDLIRKIDRFKSICEKLSEEGWNDANMVRAVILADALMKKVEDISKVLIDAWNSSDQQENKRRLEEVQEQLKQLNDYIEQQEKEIQGVVNAIYTNRLKNEITESLFQGMYNYELEQEEAKEKLDETVHQTRSILIIFRNIWWIVIAIFAFAALIGYFAKFYFEKDNLISAYIPYWIITLAIAAMLGSLLELI